MTPQNAAIYVRISDDRAGESAGVARQEADARALAERLGWQVSEVVVENDTSAYKRRTVPLPDGTTALRVVRPGFRRVLDLIAAAGIDGLIAYDLDRTARDPRDLEDLIDAVEQRDPRLPVESVTGSLRLANDSDVTMARVMVAVANKSSRDTSRRIRRKQEELAEQGRYAGGGARRYGFERDGVTVRDDEADAIREAARRVIAGESVHAVCRDFDERLIVPVKAELWSTRAMIDILRGPRVAGLRVHRGEVVGPAEWPAILDRATWDAVVAALHARSRGAGKPALIRWCTGILFCGRCGGPLSAAVAATPGAWRYWCSTRRGVGCGKIGINGAGVEGEVAAQVLDYLRRPDVAARLAETSSSQGASRARRDLADDEKQLKQLARMWAEKRITLDEYAEARRVIELRIEGARQVMLAHIPDAVRGALRAADPAEGWERLTPADKRECARLVLSVGGYKGWTVRPADLTKPRRFDPTRLVLAGREPDPERANPEWTGQP